MLQCFKSASQAGQGKFLLSGYGKLPLSRGILHPSIRVEVEFPGSVSRVHMQGGNPMRSVPELLFRSLVLAGLAAGPCVFAQGESLPQSSPALTMASLPAEERGDILMARGRYLDAVEAYREAPPTATVLNKTGIAYQHLSAVDLAKKDYQKALLIQPNYPEAINNLGAAYFAKRDYKKAIRLYRKALKLMPDSAVVAANLGTAYFARRDYRQGLEAYQTAFRLDPNVFRMDNGTVIPAPSDRADRAQQDFCVAELFAQVGNEPQAIEYLRKALNEGFKDVNKIKQDAVFTKLRQTSEFAQLMAEQKLH